ncbi:MAG: recombination mediator RecR [Gammaproteobacteria bacterium]|nr:recombination mediator RecR [Pseudomonadota bacterium]MCH9663894.1 recombination mediator RecR [Gammaproteobacteria bacterium]
MASPLQELIDAFALLPGIGAKTGQRLTYHLLDGKRDIGHRLARCLEKAMTATRRCRQCRDYSEDELCAICRDPRRDSNKLCVVEKPIDLYALEESRIFPGLYFVLHGSLSPLEGIGPDELGLPQLRSLVDKMNFTEVVLATGTTLEGEATAQIISDTISPSVSSLTRLAHGIPLGESLEYMDAGTLSLAFRARAQLKPQQ